MSDRLTIDVTGGHLPADGLSSQWGALSPHLIAAFYPVHKGGGGWVKIAGQPSVYAPLTDSSMEVALNWHSPFENMGSEAKAPMLAAMLQSGALQPVVSSLAGAAGSVASWAGSLFGSVGASLGDAVSAWVSDGSGKVNAKLSGMEGRTGITKLNSTQVFSGMPPVKIQVTVLFRAWSNPTKEVESPFNKLMEWALPVELSKDGSPVSRAINAATAGNLSISSALDVLMPSRAPVCIAMKYKGRVYSPLVIEAINDPIGSNVDSSGRYVEKQFSMTLCTLTALDREDWANSLQKP